MKEPTPTTPPTRTSSSSLPPAARSASRQEDSLCRYLAELEGRPLLSREAELEAAEEVRRSEIATWRALLSYEPALEPLARALEEAVEQGHFSLDGEQTEISRLRLSSASSVCIADLAERLRHSDVRRQGLREALRCVESWAQETSDAADGCAQREYLKRVRRAALEHSEAKQHFAEANLRLVVMVAQRHQRRGLPLADLIQEGNLGLMVAVERFDPERGFRFSTYAVWWIRHGIRRAIVNKGSVVRIPVHRVDGLRILNREIQDAQARTGRIPTTKELAEATGFSYAKVEALRLTSTSRAASLDRSMGDAEGRTFLDNLVDESSPLPDASVYEEQQNEEVRQAMTDLRPLEVSILTARFGLDGSDGMTLRSLGERYQLSRERIRQIQQAALARLRQKMEATQADALPCAGGEAVTSRATRCNPLDITPRGPPTRLARLGTDRREQPVVQIRARSREAYGGSAQLAVA